MNQGHGIAATLFAGADHDLLPVVDLLVGSITAQLDLGALAQQWTDFGNPKFGGFLYHPVHAVATGDSDTQVHAQGRLPFDAAVFVHQHPHTFAVPSGNGCLVLAALAVKEGKIRTGLESQGAADMAAGAGLQLDLLAHRQCFFSVNPGPGHATAPGPGSHG